MTLDPGKVVLLAGQFLLVAAVAYGVIVLLSSHLRYQDLFKESALLQRSGPEGLLETQLADRLGTTYRENIPFALLIVRPQDWEELSAGDRGPALIEFVRTRLTAQLRRTDTILPYGPDRLAVVVDVPLASMPAMIERLVEGLRREIYRPAGGAPVRVALHIGVAGNPEDGTRARVLRETAEAALVTARAEASTVHFASTPPPAGPHHHATQDLPEDQRGLVDELTGVLREEHLPGAMQKYVARFRDSEFPVSILCLDVDYLRRYNDQYGRKTGDQILRQIGEYLQRAVREPDLIARCEGDQFVVLLSATPREALVVAQRVATGIKRMAFQATGAPLRVSVSAGVAGFPDHGGGAPQLFLAANAAMKQAKSRGRSTVVLYDSVMNLESNREERVDVL